MWPWVPHPWQVLVELQAAHNWWPQIQIEVQPLQARPQQACSHHPIMVYGLVWGWLTNRMAEDPWASSAPSTVTQPTVCTSMGALAFLSSCRRYHTHMHLSPFLPTTTPNRSARPCFCWHHFLTILSHFSPGHNLYSFLLP
jgi:hypothetical protein